MFGDKVYEGDIVIGSRATLFASGAAIARFPKDGVLIPFELKDESEEVSNRLIEQKHLNTTNYCLCQIVSSRSDTHPVAVLGFYSVPQQNDTEIEYTDKYVNSFLVNSAV